MGIEYPDRRRSALASHRSRSPLHTLVRTQIHTGVRRSGRGAGRPSQHRRGRPEQHTGDRRVGELWPLPHHRGRPPGQSRVSVREGDDQRVRPPFLDIHPICVYVCEWYRIQSRAAAVFAIATATNSGGYCYCRCRFPACICICIHSDSVRRGGCAGRPERGAEGQPPADEEEKRAGPLVSYIHKPYKYVCMSILRSAAHEYGGGSGHHWRP